MRATWVPAVLTPATPEHVSRAIRTALTNLYGAPSDLAVAVFHGHVALETGHLKSCYGHNIWNKKASEKHEGKYQCLPLLNEVFDGVTHWYTPEGELTGGPGTPLKGKPWAVPPGEPQSRFIAYDSLAGAAEKGLEWLGTPRWRPALDLALAGLPGPYVDAIADRNYFTASRDPYRRAVVSLTQKYLPVAIATSAALPAPALPEDDDQLCRDMAECFRFELPADLAARIRYLQAIHVDHALDLVRQDRDRDVSGNQGGD